MRKFVYLSCILVGVVVNCQAYSNDDYVHDLNQSASIFVNGGDCYNNLESSTINKMIDYVSDGNGQGGVELFLNAINNVPAIVLPLNIAYNSHLMAFQIINDYFLVDSSVYNSMFCPNDEKYRRVIASNLSNEATLYGYATK